jgi:hypothetical protein
MLRSVALRQRERVHHAAQVARHQHDVGRLDGDVGAGADGDADVGLGQRRRVVDAVADEGDPRAAWRRSTASTLPPGSTSASTSSMPSCGRWRGGARLSPVIIATRAPARAAPRWPRRRLFDRVGHGDDRREPPVDRGIERRLALVAEPLARSANSDTSSPELA